MNSIFKIITLTKLVLLYICIFKYVEGGGKGKVPVYMPIPIPVPMPVQGGGGGGKFHHHHQHQHQHNNDGEGEIKKIYLLHPIPKQQHQHQTNFINHEQLPQAPPQIQQQQQQQHPVKGAGSTDMKILPIVVIPPIAPMPQIQLQGNSHTSIPKMTLSPQFNNYLLSNSDGSLPIVERGSGHFKNLRSKEIGIGSGGSYNLFQQDHKSFADYGSLYHRERPARLRARRVGVSRNSDYVPHSRIRIQDDFGGGSSLNDDYDYNQPSSWNPRSSSSNNINLRSYQQQRARLRSKNGGSSVNSIKDVMETPSIFDDEPPLDIIDTKDTISSNNGRRLLSSSSNFDDKVDRDYPDNNQYGQLGRSGSYYVKEKSYAAPGGDGQKGSENAIYYDRDYQQTLNQPAGRLSIKYTSAGTNGHNNGRRLYFDDGDLMDEDEWRFDSIKSIVHISPNATTTISTKLGENLHKRPENSSLTTTKPPKYHSQG